MVKHTKYYLHNILTKMPQTTTTTPTRKQKIDAELMVKTKGEK